MKSKYPFNLQEKEKVVEDIQPSSSLKGYFDSPNLILENHK